MSIFANSEDPDEIIRVYTICKCKKKSSDKEYIFFYYNPTPLDMYNGLFQVNCIKQEGRIH